MANSEREAIRREYCAGLLSIRAIAKKYGKSHVTIMNWAEKDGWVYGSDGGKNDGPLTTKITTGKRGGKQPGKSKSATEKLPKLKAVTAVDVDDSDADEFGFNPREYGISEQQGIFVVEYLRTKDKYAAYKKAGYKCEGDTGKASARRMYRNVSVYKAIRAGIEARQKRYDAELDEIIHQWVSIAKADPNDLVQFRRVNCRYCWGEGHKYQWRDFDEQLKAEKKAEADSKPPPDLSGGIGFVSNDEPNPECPRCNGEGEGEVHVTDTTNLIGTDARWLYAGIKQTQHGIQVLTADQDAARRNLVQLLTVQRSAGGSGDKPLANNYSPEDYRAAARSLNDELGDLD